VNPGKLRNRVRLETSRDGTTWEPVAETWAAVVPLTGAQWILGRGEGKSAPTHRVEMRFRRDLPAPLRVVHGAKILNVVAVVDVDERQVEHHLFCQEHR
jgi:SPP1 family predicted phage head-tail adaptor